VTAHPDVVIAGLQRTTKPGGIGDDDLRVMWGCGRWMPKWAKLRSETARKAERDGAAEGVERIGVGFARGLFRVDAARFPTTNFTIAVLWPQLA